VNNLKKKGTDPHSIIPKVKASESPLRMEVAKEAKRKKNAKGEIVRKASPSHIRYEIHRKKPKNSLGQAKIDLLGQKCEKSA